MASVVTLLIAPSAGQPVVAVERVRALPGAGLEGDRYAAGQGTFSKQPPRPDGELTLVQREHLEAFAAATGITFTAPDARRNVVTEGIDLNALVGRDFSVGPVRVRGHRLCEPCHHLAQRTHPAILRGLVHRGGLRAQILTAGEIRVGDAIIASDPA